MNQPSPGLYAAVLHAFSSTDPHSRPLDSTMTELAEGLTSAHAESLPQALAEVMPLLRGDPERLNYAAEAALRLGFFEVAGAVAELALATDDRRLLLNAASLCGNPAVANSVRARVAAVVSADPAGRMRLDPNAVPSTADEKRLHLQCWPGARHGQVPFALAPVVVLDDSYDALRLLKLAVRLDQVGAVVRRLAVNSGVPLWFGSQTVLVCRAPTRSRVLSSYQRFPEAQILVEDSLPDDDRELNILLRNINAALPGAQKLRFARAPLEIAASLWGPDVFTAGVYQTKETAFLSGTSASSMHYMRRRGLLQPMPSKAVRWTFSHLVAVRTWSYLQSCSPKRVSSRVVPALAQFAGDSEAVRLGVMSNGAVLVDHGNGWCDVETGQAQMRMDITDIDDVFQPFPYGGGTVVPLLEASPNTRLHPAVLHGTPHLVGRRISARALAGLHNRGGDRAIVSAYPELDEVVFDDTVEIGRRLLAPA